MSQDSSNHMHISPPFCQHRVCIAATYNNDIVLKRTCTVKAGTHEAGLSTSPGIDNAVSRLSLAKSKCRWRVDNTLSLYLVLRTHTALDNAILFVIIFRHTTTQGQNTQSLCAAFSISWGVTGSLIKHVDECRSSLSQRARIVTLAKAKRRWLP